MSENNDFHADRAESLIDVRGQAVLVTGAASGIGRAAAQVMAANGARVMLADRDGDGVARATEELTAAGLDVCSEILDVADAHDVERVVSAAVERFGRLDVTFANAGINRGPSLRYADGEIDRLSDTAWDEVLAVNLRGTLATIRSSAEVMKRQRAGSIVVTASTSGIRPEPMVSYAYVAAKTAVISIVRQAAVELAAYGVRINAIAPGPIVTNIAAGRPKPADYVQHWTQTIPLGRRGLPDDIKGPALLLASPAAGFVTGAVWEIDGGASALTQGRMSDVGPVRAPAPGSDAAAE